mgnify:CR=1 FL=1
MTRNSQRNAGYTLVELMMVVVIIGVLAATAIPSFRRQVLRSRAAESIAMLGQIRMRQEAYRSEFGQYFGTTTFTANWPTSTPSDENVPWGNAASSPLALLGVSPDGPVYFRYRVMAGYDNAPAAQYPAGYPDWWYVAQATGDIDGDGTTYFVEAIAGRAELYVSSPAGFE